jgi:hypothetical protein
VLLAWFRRSRTGSVASLRGVLTGGVLRDKAFFIVPCQCFAAHAALAALALRPLLPAAQAVST